MKHFFVDIHTHILPGLDDGSQDEETSLQMAEIAAGSGTKCLVCTKHTDMTEPVSQEDGRLIMEGVRLDEMCAIDGIVPVIAHPERYYCVQEEPERIYNWVMDGCLTQCNRASFEGKFGDREEVTALRLLDANLVTCIASDAHSSRQRTPRLDNGFRQIASRYGEWAADLLLRKHPERMIRNEALEIRGNVRHVNQFPVDLRNE